MTGYSWRNLSVLFYKAATFHSVFDVANLIYECKIVSVVVKHHFIHPLIMLGHFLTRINKVLLKYDNNNFVLYISCVFNSAKEVTFSHCLFVCLLAGICKMFQ